MNNDIITSSDLVNHAYEIGYEICRVVNDLNFLFFFNVKFSKGTIFFDGHIAHTVKTINSDDLKDYLLSIFNEQWADISRFETNHDPKTYGYYIYIEFSHKFIDFIGDFHSTSLCIAGTSEMDIGGGFQTWLKKNPDAVFEYNELGKLGYKFKK